MNVGTLVKQTDSHLFYRVESPPIHVLEKLNYKSVDVLIKDNRVRSAKQNAKVHAIFGEIAKWSGYDAEIEIKPMFKHWFMAVRELEYFSMSDVDMTTCKEFIEFLIEFCLENDVPTMFPLLDKDVDVYKWVYWCAVYKRCCVCQKSGKGIVHLHHHKRIGIGRNRKEIVHENYPIQTLCSTHHRESHNGQESFDDKYKLVPVLVDKTILKVYKLKH